MTPLWPERVYQWHREGFDLPHGGELLAEGDIFRVQAFRYGCRLWHPISPGSHPSDDVPLDHARARAHGACLARADGPSISPTARSTIRPCAPGSASSSIIWPERGLRANFRRGGGMTDRARGGA